MNPFVQGKIFSTKEKDICRHIRYSTIETDTVSYMIICYYIETPQKVIGFYFIKILNLFYKLIETFSYSLIYVLF